MLAFLLGTFVILQFAVRLSTTIQIGADEGFELGKATLCLRGYRLYTDIWNDQPPLHTFIITEVLKHVSPSILGPRLVTTGFTLLLLTSVFFISLRVSGLLVAGLTTGLLIVSPGFLELGSSCMLEIPALACAVAGLWVLVGAGGGGQGNVGAWERERGNYGRAELPRRLSGCAPVAGVVAGAVFAAALMIKLVDVYILPLVVVVLWLRLCKAASPVAGMAVSPTGTVRGSATLPSRGPNFGDRGIEYTKRSPHPGPLPIGWGEGEERQPACVLHSVASSVNPGSMLVRRTVWDFTTTWLRSGLLRLTEPRSGAGANSGPGLALALVIFGASLAVSCVAIDWLIENGAYLLHFRQSWVSHFGPTNTLAYGSAGDHPFDWSILLKNWDVTIPAVAGIGVFLSRLREESAATVSDSGLAGRQPQHARARALPNPSVLPLAWLALSFGVFTIHRPWWAYYYIHNSIPLCWCAAGGIGWAVERARARCSRGVIAVLGLAAAGAFCWPASRVYLQMRNIRNSPQSYRALVLKEIERLKPWTEWIYADEPIYSFHCGIPMPPQLAVLVLKRFWAGEMDNERITGELRKFKPGVILLANDAREVPFKELLDAEYQVVYEDTEHRLYALRGIARKRGWGQ